MKTSLTVGDKCKVKIHKPETYAFGCAECLQGKTGVVDEVRSNGKILVKFDTPAKTWSSNQLPVNAFWFDPDEVLPL